MEPAKGFKGILLDALGLKPDGASLPVADSADAAAPSAGDLLPQHAAAEPDDVAEKPARAHLDEHDELFAARLLNISQWFASDASAARDAQQSLQQAHQQARTKEREVLAAADAAYTPAWRQTGIPSKPSQLQLDEALVSGCRLLDPAAIIMRQHAHQQKEVLQPPAVFAYCDKAADPHFLQTTGNQKVREKISATRITAVRTAKQRQQQDHAPCSTAALQQEQQQQQEQQIPPALQDQPPSLQQQQVQQQQQISTVSRDRLKMDPPSRQQHTVVQQRGSPSRARAKAVGSVPWSQLPAEEAASKVAAAAARYKAMAAIMTPEQRQLEEKIIKSMYQRLSYLRNPRYTEQPKAAPPGSAGLKGTSIAHRHRRSQHSSSSSSKHPRQQTAGGFVTAAAAGFSYVPQQGVLFQAYEPGGVYFHAVQLQNTGTVMKQLRLLPPQSCYFQISFPRFPLESSALAPGMCAEVDVCFMPDSLGDYEDTFTVDTPAGKFEVHLTGRRPHPELTLPPVLEVGSVLVGNTRTRTFEFVNKGGEGRFLLLTAQQWAATLQQRGHLQGSPPPTTQLYGCADGTSQAAAEHITDSADASLCCSPVSEAKTEGDGTTFTSTMQVDSAGSNGEPPSVTSVSAGPFSISPAYLDLPAGAAALIAVEFSPQQQGLQGQELVLVCDNCTAHPLRVEGCGAEVQVELVGLDDRQWLPQDEQMPLWFGEVCPGASSTRQLRVFNATDLPFPFHWSVTSSQPQSDPSTASSAAHSTGSPFTVSPAAGVLQAQAEVSFTVEFTPQLTAPHSGALKLCVQRSGDAGLLSISQWGRDGTAIMDLTSTAASGNGLMTLAHTSAVRTAAAGGSSLQRFIREDAAGEDNAGAGDVPIPRDPDSTAAAEGGGAGTGERQEAPAWPGSSDWQVVADIAVEGVGCAISLTVEPAAAVRVPGTLTVGQETSLPLQLRNNTAAPACFTITEAGPAPEWTNSVNGRGPSADVVVLPSQGVVPPHSVLDLAMHFTALRAGCHQQGFVVEVLHGRRQHLQADVVVQQVKVVPSYPRLDFGVLCVGTSTTRTLQLQNTAPHSSSCWCIQQHGNQACVPPTVLTCQPSQGTLAPMTCCTAAVTLTGTSEGTHKLLLRVSSNSDGCISCSNSSSNSSAAEAAAADKAGCSSSSSCCCNHEYVQVLVTVSSPKVVLSRYRLPIQHAFTGVPQHHRLSMTNTSALPLTFSWAVQQLPHEQYIRLQTQLQQQQQPAGTTGHIALPVSSRTEQQPQADMHEPYMQREALSSSSSSVAGSGAAHNPLQSEHSTGQISLSISPSTGQLGPGQSLQLQLHLEPLAVGPVALLCCCQVAAMSRLVGFVLTADVEGLQVQYEVLQPEVLLWQVQAARSKPRHSKHGSSRSSSPGGRTRSSIPSRVSSALSCTAATSQVQQQRVRYDSAAQDGAVKSSASAQDSAGGSILRANALERPDKVATEVVVADFGTVALHQPAELVLQVTNLTSIPTELRAWVAQFPAQNQVAAAQAAATSCHQPVTGTHRSPASSAVPNAATATRLCHSPVWSAGSQQHQLSSKSRTSSPCSGSPSAHTRLSSPQHKGRPVSPEHLLSAACVAWKLTRTDPGTHSGRRVDSSSSIAAEALISTVNSIPQLAQMQASSTQSSGSGGSSVSATLKGPFRAFAGNAMMAARQAAAAAAAALGSSSAGCAVHLLPDACQLPGWGRSVLRLQAFNNLPGTYVDTLSVQVGDLPPQQIPIILRVEGSPLVLSNHRAQRAASEVLHTLLHHQHQQLLSSHRAQAAQHTSVTQQIDGAHNGSCKEGDSGSGGSGSSSGGCESSSGEAVGPGAAGSGSVCRVDLGVVPAGLQVQRAFFLCNTGPLPMHITWEWPALVGSSSTGNPSSTCRQDAVSHSSEMAAAGPEGAAASPAAAAATGLGLCDQQTSLELGGDHGSLAESRPVSAAVPGQPGQEASRPTSTGSISSNPGPAGKISASAGPGKKAAAAAAPGGKAAAVGASGGSKADAGKAGAATKERRASGVSAAAAGSAKIAAGRAAAEQDPSTDSEEQQHEQETAPSSALEGPGPGPKPTSPGDVNQSIATHDTDVPGSSSGGGGGGLPQGCDTFDADLPPGGPSSLLQLLQKSSTALEVTAGHASTGDACGSSAMAPAAPDNSQHSSRDSSSSSAAGTLFKVVPEACVLPAGQQQQFTVSFCSWEATSAQQVVVLSGRQSFSWAGEAVGPQLGGAVLQSGSDQYLKLHLLPQTGGSSNHGQAQQKLAATSGPTQCCITGGFHPHAAPPPRPLPALTLQLSARAAAPHLTLTDPDSFTFTYSRAHDGLSSQPGLQQTATMHNSTGCPQVFSLAVQGPFELVAAAPSVSQDPDAFRGLLGCDSWLQSHKGCEPQATMMGVMQHGSRQNQEPGLMLLPPGESVDVTIRFRPPPVCSTQLQQNPSVIAASGRTSEAGLAVARLTRGGSSSRVPGVPRADSMVARAAPMIAAALPGTGRSTATAADGVGQLECPGSEAVVAPRKSEAEADAAAGSSSNLDASTMPLIAQHLGLLTVNFATSQQQCVPLAARVLQPALEAPTKLDFGEVHMAAPRTLELLLTNPTQADAAYKAVIQHMEVTGAQNMTASEQLLRSAAVAAYSVVPASGMLPGRGIQMPRQTRLHVTFAPQRSGPASACLQLSVKGGGEVLVMLQGVGVHAERAEPRAAFDL